MVVGRKFAVHSSPQFPQTAFAANSSPTPDPRPPTTLNTMFIVLTYDISDDRRRTQLFKTLKRFGFAVQESVFEFHLNHGELRILKRAIRAIIDPNLDQVRLYNLCPTCHHRTEMTYPSRETANPFVLIA